MKTNIAVIGAGYWGKNLIRIFNELKVLKIICDENTEVLSKFKEQYKDIKITTDFNEVLSNKIDAVVVVTPALTHYAIVKKALLSGKDVFVEKPLALNIEDGQELISIANNNKKILMIGHILHYHPAIKKLKEIIKKGGLGKIQYIYSNRLNIGKIRTEENILWSFAPHDISLILSLTNEMPQEVHSFGAKYLQEDVEDVTMTFLKFKSGINAHIFVNWLNPFKEQKFVVVGNKKMVVFDDINTAAKLTLFSHKISWQGGKIPIAEKAAGEVVKINNNEPLKEECLHFLKCIEERKKPVTDGEEGLNVLKVLHQAEESLKKLKTESVTNLDFKKNNNYFIHPTSIVDEKVEIKKGTKIWHFSHILKNTKIGANCVIGQNVMIGPDVEVGDNVKVQNNVSIYKGVKIEDDVFCGPSCVFTNVINPRSFIERKQEFKNTLVEKGATIGANATIICGVNIGKYAFVGAGSVVTKNVPANALVVGVPAKTVGWMCKCGNKLILEKSKLICKNCGNEYLKEKYGIKVLREL